MQTRVKHRALLHSSPAPQPRRGFAATPRIVRRFSAPATPSHGGTGVKTPGSFIDISKQTKLLADLQRSKRWVQWWDLIGYLSGIGLAIAGITMGVLLIQTAGKWMIPLGLLPGAFVLIYTMAVDQIFWFGPPVGLPAHTGFRSPPDWLITASGPCRLAVRDLVFQRLFGKIQTLVAQVDEIKSGETLPSPLLQFATQAVDDATTDKIQLRFQHLSENLDITDLILRLENAHAALSYYLRAGTVVAQQTDHPCRTDVVAAGQELMNELISPEFLAQSPRTQAKTLERLGRSLTTLIQFSQ